MRTNSPNKSNTISLADAYNRVFMRPVFSDTVVDNSKQIDLPILPPEPEYTVLESGQLSPFRIKPIGTDYPHISTQPEYKVEADKLAHFHAQREEAVQHRDHLTAEYKSTWGVVNTTEEDAIAKAESLLAGEAAKNFEIEIAAASRLIQALDAAIIAQIALVKRVNQDLSHAAARHHSKAHKEAVKRLAAAAIEIHAANEAEKAVRYDLVRLGYAYAGLPTMNMQVEDPTDASGNVTYYWHREARQYTKTVEELAAGARKGRLAALLD
jgi:hypothetical protein